MKTPRLRGLARAIPMGLLAGVFLTINWMVFSERSPLVYSIGTTQLPPANTQTAPADPLPPQTTDSNSFTITAVVGSHLPDCTPATSYGLPSRLDLSAVADGLTVVKDPTEYYQIYGRSGAALRRQLASCAPTLGGSAGGEYSGETSYSLTWQYAFLLGQNTCRLTNVRVGLHLNMILPLWRGDTLAANNLKTQWDSFVAGLQTHENGHTDIDRQYATRLMNDLQNLQTDNCTNLASLAQTTIASDTAAINQANDNYDTVTDHGATQGAALNF